MSAEVERIVREVLERLRGTGMNGAAAAGSAIRKQLPHGAGDLVLSGRVIAVADLEGRLDGVNVLVTHRTAIVTPAARDLLREQGVTLASRVGPTTEEAAARLTLGMAETEFDAAELVRGLRSERIE